MIFQKNRIISATQHFFAQKSVTFEAVVRFG
jgi:hypothetical protein